MQARLHKRLEEIRRERLVSDSFGDLRRNFVAPELLRASLNDLVAHAQIIIGMQESHRVQRAVGVVAAFPPRIDGEAPNLGKFDERIRFRRKDNGLWRSAEDEGYYFEAAQSLQNRPPTDQG